MKLALGSTHSRVAIDGTTTTTVPGTVPVTYAGGILAQPTNIGVYEQDFFSVMPELGVAVGYDLTCRLRVTCGYTILYWSKVARPGDQIDTELNPSQFPPGRLLVGAASAVRLAHHRLLGAGLERRAGIPVLGVGQVGLDGRRARRRRITGKHVASSRPASTAVAAQGAYVMRVTGMCSSSTHSTYPAERTCWPDSKAISPSSFCGAPSGRALDAPAGCRGPPPAPSCSAGPGGAANVVPLRIGQHVRERQFTLARRPGDAGDEFSAGQREPPPEEFAGEGNLCEAGGDGQLQRHRLDVFAGGLADVQVALGLSMSIDSVTRSTPGSGRSVIVWRRTTSGLGKATASYTASVTSARGRRGLSRTLGPG